MKHISVLATSTGNDGFPSVLMALKKSEAFSARVVATDSNLSAVGIQMADAGYVVPTRQHEEELLSALLKIIDREQIDVLLPLSTLDQPFFAKHRQRFEQAGVPVVVSSLEALEIANNKFLLLQLCQRINTASADFDLVKSIEDIRSSVERLGFPNNPVVFKLNEGTGSQGVKIIDPTISRFERFIDRDNMRIRIEDLYSGLEDINQFPNAHIVEYLPGDEFSVDVFSEDGDTKSLVVRRRISSLYGLATHSQIVDRPDIELVARRIINELNLSYVNNLQFKEDSNGTPKIMEINPRIPGTIGHTVASGVNMVSYAVQSALGMEIVFARPKNGFEMLRTWQLIEVVRNPKDV